MLLNLDRSVICCRSLLLKDATLYTFALSEIAHLSCRIRHRICSNIPSRNFFLPEVWNGSRDPQGTEFGLGRL